MNLLGRLLGRESRAITTIDDYAAALNSFYTGGEAYAYGLNNSGIQQTLAGRTTEQAPNNFTGLATHAYQANGVIFACMLVRMLVFSSVRFRWQRLRDGKPSDTFGNPDLQLLERPWIGGTTQDLLVRMIQCADLAGNAYVSRQGDELVLLRPDWVDIALEPRDIRGGRGELGGGQLGWRKAGYLYWEGGRAAETDPVWLFPEDVAHFAPIPDPLANYRGMSWLTPVIREIQADQAMTHFQQRFLDNGATPNLIVKHFPGAPGIAGATQEGVKKWVEEFDDKTSGIERAGKTMHLYPGADATVVGSNLKEIEFKVVRGHGETRIAAAAGVPPVIVGLSEGLQAATYSNYGQARRRFADGTAHPLWQNLAGSMERVLPSLGPDVRLWYDADDVPFLREDEKDAADIQNTRAETINTLITAGYEPDSVVRAVESGDLRLLKHTGLTSVQLSAPGEKSDPVDNPGGSEDDDSTG
ncbi:phage portal protein [Mycolicibacterium vaccae]|uniref:phage portal protein n=1 Tax=Mycolicibacterium vaccae TaxID=1810 RepID=UPI003CFCD276